MRKIIILFILSLICGCSDKLELKPNSSLITLQTTQDLENLLDNSEVMNVTSPLPQLSADEYYIPTIQNFNALATPITRTAYIWQADIFQGASQVKDWAGQYAQVFLSNNILEALNKGIEGPEADKERIKGWALFSRAYSFYTLVSVFSKAYNDQTAVADLGIPIKTTSDITDIVPRSSVAATYAKIIDDAVTAASFLPQDVPPTMRNRPSKVAVYAFLARVYLSMRKYPEAESYADKTLALYSTLTDYKNLPSNATSSFTYNSEETIYFSRNLNSLYGQTIYASPTLYSVDTTLYNSYGPYDYRRTIFFRRNNITGYIGVKGINTRQTVPFTGLATDEIYLIKAECLARRGESSAAMDVLNKLLIKRWNPNGATPAKQFDDVTATNAAQALDLVLAERRKQLIWRSLRWTDLKRLNLEGRNITLKRVLDGQTYMLEPNSPRYVLPIPDDEVALSGIEQNVR